MTSKITHIGVVVHDLDAAIRLWVENYGFKLLHRVDVEVEGAHTAMLSPSETHGAMAVELIEPIDKTDMSNAFARRLASKGEGFYHLGMTVDDVAARGKALVARGVKVVELAPADVGKALQGVVKPAVARHLVHPKSSNGIMVELLQSV